MKASDAVAKLLAANDIKQGFELIGGMITHLVDSINSLNKTALLSLHHEQAVAFAAGAVARATNNNCVGLALATSGPGATNLITGIADCWLDSCPCVFITGQVNSYELKGERTIRQQGFQELDVVSLVQSITKYAVQIQSADELLPEIQKAINLSKSGRPGPVLIDIPMDFQRDDINIDDDAIYELSRINQNNIETCHENFTLLSQLLESAKKPLFIIGGGACKEPLFTEWQKMLSRYHIPHVASLKGSESVVSCSGYLGLLGGYGTRAANIAVQNADLVVVLGSRLDVKQTGADIDDFARCAKNIVQIDIDEAQINNRVNNHVSIVSKCDDYFKYALNTPCKVECDAWYCELVNLFTDTFQDEYDDVCFSPFQLITSLSNCFRDKKVQFTADVGNHQMWLAHTLRLCENQKIHYSGGLGAMGFSLPTAIGIKSSSRDFVVSLSGDGGFHLNSQELDIINREKLPILIIVLNNHSLGMVRNFQDMYFNGRNQPTYWDGYSSSFINIGRAYGIESHFSDNNEVLVSLLQDYINNPRPLLIEASMKDAITCKPRLAFGKPIDEQYP